MNLDKIIRVNDLLLAVYRVILLQFLWLSVTLLGGVVFGIGPATYALMKTYDRWLRLKEQPPMIRQFFHYSKERFRQSVLISWLIGLSMGIVVTNLFNAGSWFIQIANLLFLVALLFMFMNVYSIMAAVNYPSIKAILKGSLLLGFGYLHYSIITWSILVAGYLLIATYLPILIVCAGVSIFGLIIATSAQKIINDIHTKSSHAANTMIR
jgi:uncharacterized membrane protein YesL